MKTILLPAFLAILTGMLFAIMVGLFASILERIAAEDNQLLLLAVILISGYLSIKIAGKLNEYVPTEM